MPIYYPPASGGGLTPISNGQVLANISGSTAVPTGNGLSAVLDSIYGSTQGTLLERGSAAWQEIGPGNAAQILTSNGASSDPTFTALSSVLDVVFGNSQGEILYRGASGWAALAPGTKGYGLGTGGASANPSWAPEVTPLFQQNTDNPLTGSTAETSLASFTIPAGTMGPNDSIRIMARWGTNNSAGTKTLRVRVGGSGIAGTLIWNFQSTTSASNNLTIEMNNRNATNAQSLAASGTMITTTASGAALQTQAFDMTLAQLVAFTGQLGSGTDTMTLAVCRVELIKGA